MGSHQSVQSIREDAVRRDHELSDKHPGFQPYKECIGRSYAWGLATFSIVFSGTYFGQKVLHMPVERKYYILNSCLLAVIASYKITKDRAGLCRDILMADRDVNES